MCTSCKMFQTCFYVLGEKLTDEDVEQLLQGHEDKQGNVNYEGISLENIKVLTQMLYLYDVNIEGGKGWNLVLDLYRWTNVLVEMKNAGYFNSAFCIS